MCIRDSVLTPEVKQAIADEVKAEIAAERDAAAAQASAPAAAAAPAADSSQSASATPAEVPPDALNPNLRTFIVADTLNPQLADGTECSLSQGDVLTRIDDTPDANQNVKVLVSGSQKMCIRDSVQGPPARLKTRQRLACHTTGARCLSFR